MLVHRNSTTGNNPRSSARSALAVGVVGVLLALACGKKAPEIREEPGAPTSATYQLAPSAAVPARARENVLAATSEDANAPNGVAVPAVAAPPARTVGAAAAPPATAPSPTCINGWSAPERGSPLRGAVLDMMRVRPGERFVVEEMRYFVGPEDAEVLGVRGDVERWYVKAYTEGEPRRRQRWLARRARIGSGVDAIAPFDSTGYGPGTWRRPDAPDEGLADPFERPCQGTEPGEKCMGLPREVLGCLRGT